MKGVIYMKKLFKLAVVILSLLVFLQVTALANESVKRPPKPTEGIESSNPNHGSSTDIDAIYHQKSGSLYCNYECSIDKTGSDLYLEGLTMSLYISDQVGITLYLQKWEGSQWIDIQNWSFTKYNAKTIIDGQRVNYQSENYYRTRAVHNIKLGTQSETQNSISSYVYID